PFHPPSRKYRTFILRDRLLFKEVFTNFSIFVHAIRACSVNAILAVTTELIKELDANRFNQLFN
ncbi:hypothetical protein, partial [Priestia aryabhattai]|uniref:hypothetical protein n=1 Tax=Priestia aryabhattai TaxID=412384 RepID=UPI001C8D1F5A